jgi:membrane associated rhomboid family serine protease
MSTYHRDEVFRRLTIAEPLTPAMVTLLIAFAAVFALQLAAPPFNQFALNYLAMDTGAFLAKGRVWQAVTAIFLHGSVCHFLMNMMFFWFFGSLLANSWRQREFLSFFFTCGLVASLCFFAIGAVAFPAPVKGLGASGAVMGLMAGCALVCGDRIVLAFFFIPMKLKHFVAVCLALDLLVLIGTGGLAEAAHVGGAVCGAVYIKLAWWRQRRLAGGSCRGPKVHSRIEGLEFPDDERR